MKPQFLAALGVAAFLPTLSLAQSSIPRCSADMPVLQVTNQFLDADGYPLQQRMNVQQIAGTTTRPCMDRYVFLTDYGPIVAPDAIITYSGTWERIAQRRVAREGASEEMSYSSGMAISEETAHEISASLGVGVTGGFKPLGIGVEATVEASAGYAYSMASGTENSQDWEHTVSIEPGEEVVIWARRLRVHAQWTPSDSYSLTDPFGAPLRYIEETFLPSQVQEWLLNPEISETIANSLIVPIRFTYTYPNPPTNAHEVTTHARAMSQMLQFLDAHSDTIESEYLLPMNETYTVRYTY